MLCHLMVFGNFQGSETRNGIFGELIFGPGIFWGFVGSSRDFLEFWFLLPFDHLRHFNSKTVAPSPNPAPPPPHPLLFDMMIVIRSPARERGSKLLHLGNQYLLSSPPSIEKVLANYLAEKTMGKTLWHQTLIVEK